MIEEAINLIEEQTIGRNPVVMSSFGKDSMVLLDLISRAGLKFPIVFFKEPFFPKKYEFANKVILDNEYVVYDYPPITTSFSRRGDIFEIVNQYQMKNNTIYLPTGIKPTVEGKFLCGLEDIYHKPVGTFKFPWDTLLIGHKSSDVDPILGHLPLKEDTFEKDGINFVYPLRHFTDKDIWKYTIENNLPINDRRYNRDNNWKEFEDVTYNPDYFETCIECMKSENPRLVQCPKKKTSVPNIAVRVKTVTVDLSHYVGV